MMPMGVDIQAYYCSTNKQILNSTYKNGNSSTKEIKTDNELNKVYDIRKPRKNPCSWEISSSDMELLQGIEKKSVQFTLENENDHLVLVMRFNSLFDSNNDVIILNFRPELSFFGIEGGQIKMNTESKTIISNLLYKSSIAVLQQSQEDYKNHKKFSDKTRSTIDNVKLYKEKYKQLSEDHHKNIVNIAQSFISGLSTKYCVEFVFTNECIDALKGFSSNLPRLKVIVESAAEYAYNLNSFSKSRMLIIEEEYLDLGVADTISKNNENTQAKPKIKQGRRERAESMLSKIEQAVKIVIANKENITGVNVGKAFKSPISAAAITDYLKKHFEEINEILDENPSKYPESKQYFKPLKNIIRESKRVKTA